jgi:hypothetical protein
MTLFHQFSVFAASRGEGLHPKLRALPEAVRLPFSEVSMRRDGMIQADRIGLEVVSSCGNVTPFSRAGRPHAALTEMQELSTAIRNETVPFVYRIARARLSDETPAGWSESLIWGPCFATR